MRSVNTHLTAYDCACSWHIR